jgi:hypothetical protein
MAGTERLSRLRLVAVATFRATTFLLAIALLLHLRGDLPAVLHALDTTTGLVAFAAFWTSTLVASSIGVASLDRDLAGWQTRKDHWASTTIAGCWNGTFVFLAAFLIRVLTLNVHAPIDAVFAALFIALLGALVAFAFGGIFGAIYGAIETLLLSVGARLITGGART